MAQGGGGFLARRRSGDDPTRPARVLVASGRVLNLTDREEAKKVRALRQGWQADAWSYRDALPEVRYTETYIANCARRIRIFPAYYDDPRANPVPVEHSTQCPPDLRSAAIDATDRIGAGRLGMAAIMADLASNFEIAGEAYLYGGPDPDDPTEELWGIRSVDEIRVDASGNYQRRDLPDNVTSGNVAAGWIDLDPAIEFVSRLWVPHPRFGLLADSPMRAMLDLCEELLILSRMVRATGRSRLATAGIIKFPEELKLVLPGDEEDLDLSSEEGMQRFFNALMAGIVEEGVAAAVAPLVVRGKADALKALEHMTLDRPLDPAMAAQRAELIGRMATGFDLPREVLEGVSDLNHWPVPVSTRILTLRRGWRHEHEIVPGEPVVALDHATGQAVIAPIAGTIRAHVVDRPMVRLIAHGVDALATEDHRWPVLRDGERLWLAARDVAVGDRLIRAAPNRDLPTVAKYDDDLVRLVAWYSADGTAIGSTPQVRIGKSHKENPDKVAELRGVLERLYGPARLGPPRRRGMPRSGDPVPSWREDRQARGMTLFCLNKAAAAPLLAIVASRDKVIPTDFVSSLTYGQLLLFLEAWGRSDGLLRLGGGIVVNQRDERRLDAVALAAVLAGRPIGYSTAERSGGFSDGTQHFLRIPRKYSTVPVIAVVRESYTGDIWCPRVPVGTSMIARADNGSVFFTGNSAWQVDDNVFRHHIEPGTITHVDSLTVGYLRNTVSVYVGGVIPPPVLRRLVYWYDAQDLTSNPNESADALTLHERLVISDSALREKYGYDDKQAPSNIELELRMIRGMRTFPPNVVLALMHTLDPTLVIPPAAPLPGMGPTGAIAPPAPPALGPGPAPKPDEPPVTGGPGEPGQPPSSGPGSPSAPSSAPPGSSGAPAVTAAGSVALSAASRRLTRTDRDLRTRLHAAANAAVAEVLSRAGAKIRTKGAKNPTVATAISGRSNGEVARVLGPAVVGSLGLSASDLVAGDWSALAEKFHAWVFGAQATALSVAADMAGVANDDPSVAAVASALGAARATAWDRFSAALTGRAQALLFDSSPGPSDDEGDLSGRDPDTLVPMGLVRSALALAGGAGDVMGSAGVSDSGTAAMSGEVLGQIGTGPILTGFLSDNGLDDGGYEWHHGATARPFDPHVALDGVQFASWTDDALANTDDWPPAEFFIPGDHDGCSCDFTVLWSPSDDNGTDAGDGGDGGDGS